MLTNRRLGRVIAPANPNVPTFKAVLPNREPPKEESNWWAGVPAWLMGENDALGTCVVANAANALLAESTYTGAPKAMSNDEVVATYSMVGGYKPGEPATDNGLVIETFLTYWVNNGITVSGTLNKLSAFASVDVKDLDEVKSAIDTLGGLTLGVNLPISAQAQTYLWMPTNDGDNSVPNSWGAHCVRVIGYDPYGVYAITWGTRVKILWEFWRQYVSEAHATLDPAFMTATGRSPADIPWAQLQAAILALR